MPLYSYKCLKCQSDIDLLQPMGVDVPECQVCGQRLERQMKPFVIKGKSARRRWCEDWTPNSRSFKFGDWRDKTEEAEKALYSENK